MMKQVLYALTLVLALVGCSKYEVFERNLQYATPQIFQEEKADMAGRYEAAQAALANAQSSGDPRRIKKATADFKEVEAQYKIVQQEELRRQRGW